MLDRCSSGFLWLRKNSSESACVCPCELSRLIIGFAAFGNSLAEMLAIHSYNSAHASSRVSVFSSLFLMRLQKGLIPSVFPLLRNSFAFSIKFSSFLSCWAVYTPFCSLSRRVSRGASGSSCRTSRASLSPCRSSRALRSSCSSSPSGSGSQLRWFFAHLSR